MTTPSTASGRMQPSLWAQIRGLVQASHPFPIAMVIALTALVGLASARAEVDSVRLAAAVAAMLFSQLAIGWSNDYLDRGHDAVYQPDKPVPSGLVAASLLLILAPLSVVLSLAFAVALGATVTAWLVAGTACGLGYDVAFKNTRLSWLPYVVAFAVLPPFVWTATESYRSAFLWLYPLCAPLAVAAHLANSLPDIEGDTAAQDGGVTMRLGRQRAIALLYACLLAPGVLIVASTAWLAYDTPWLAATLLAFLGLTAAAVPAYWSKPFRRGAAVGFRIIAPASVLLAAGWLAAIR
ncbi:MAG TPA: UbiA family prenyltransferase [Dehalococcoidia bacterium]